jgi:hypothetical protein
MRPYFFSEVCVKDCSGNPFLRNEEKIGTKSLVSLLAKTPILFLQILLFVLKKNDEKTNAKLNKAIWRGIRIQKIEESTIQLTC